MSFTQLYDFQKSYSASGAAGTEKVLPQGNLPLPPLASGSEIVGKIVDVRY